jgi:hypothetical protein
MKWICPCGHENEDFPEETAMPICGDCEAERDWTEIEEAP